MEVEPVRQDELNHDREKVNTFDKMFKRIAHFRGVFSFSVILNNHIFQSNMGEEKIDKMCKNWPPILDKLNRELKDIDDEDDLISLQVSTVEHELVIVEGLIKRDPEKRYRLIVQQYTPSSVVPQVFRSLVKGKLSQMVKEKDYSSLQDYKKLLWGEDEEPKSTVQQREHPVETEVLRRREVLGEVSIDRTGRQRKVLQRVLADIMAVKPSHRAKEQSDSSRSRRSELADRELLEMTREKNRLSWLPEKAGEELESLSVGSTVKERLRRALKMNRFEGSLKVLKLQDKQRRMREQRKLHRKLALVKSQF